MQSAVADSGLCGFAAAEIMKVIFSSQIVHFVFDSG